MTQKFVSVGSHAAPANVITRARSDYDFIADIDTAQEMIRAKGIVVSCVPNHDGSKLIAKYKHQVPSEAEIAWTGTSAERILNYCIDKRAYNAPMEVLLMMKLSHRYLKNSPHFAKTMKDIWAFRKAGVKLEDPELIDILKQREEETYTYAHPKLNVDKKDFFSGDGVNYVIDHDLIHEYVKLWSKPIYQKIAVVGQEVFSSKDKFFCELSDQEQLSAVWEESAVLAIERSLLPFPGTLTPHQAFLKALEKVCTSITSGWFREYAWENYYKVATLFSPDSTTLKIEEAYKKCLSK